MELDNLVEIGSGAGASGLCDLGSQRVEEPFDGRGPGLAGQGGYDALEGLQDWRAACAGAEVIIDLLDLVLVEVSVEVCRGELACGVAAVVDGVGL